MNENSLNNLRPYKKGQSGNKKGRPKKFVLTLKKEGYKLNEINDTIQAMMAMDLNDLKDIWDNESSTILEKTVAGALRKSLEGRKLDSLETLLTRVYGRPKEKVDVQQDINITQHNIKLKFGNGESE
jgi:hypothetical protein